MFDSNRRMVLREKDQFRVMREKRKAPSPVTAAWIPSSGSWIEGLAAGECYFQGFIKHPQGIPLDFSIDTPCLCLAPKFHNVHSGGMVFNASWALPVGANIHLSVNLQSTDFTLHGIVAHTVATGRQCYDIGVQFEQEVEYHSMRMIEQACHIESYRKQACCYGHEITQDQAAKEWIERFAAHFPS